MTTIHTTSPFRFDIVGSFLRPERLKQARADFEKWNDHTRRITSCRR